MTFQWLCKARLFCLRLLFVLRLPDKFVRKHTLGAVLFPDPASEGRPFRSAPAMIITLEEGEKHGISLRKRRRYRKGRA